MKTTTRFKVRFILGATLSYLSIMGSSSVLAWGPERTTFTMEDPATYPTFNSITNNPTIGDERDFVRIGEINADVTELKNEIEIVPGRQYLVYIYFHNNASATYNDAAHNNSGVAFQTRMATSFSTVLTPAERGIITGTISAENSNPLAVWDEAYMTTRTGKVLLHYVSGSAKIYNDWKANGSVMSSDLFSEQGTYIGLNSLNGIILGCEEYHGIVTYVIQAEELGGSIDKTVSTDGINYIDTLEGVATGSEVYFKLTIKNTGDVALTNAVVSDTLPEGLTLVPSSVELSANDSSVKDALSDNIIGGGYNLGTIGTGNTVYITYRAKVAEDLGCDSLTLINNAELIYDSEKSSGDKREDGATIITKKDGCTPAPVPEEELPTEIVNTGPLEIVLAAIIIIGIAGGGFYLYRTHHALKTVENKVSGKTPEAPTSEKSDNSDEEPKA